jgi:hypothetical protein
MAGTHPDDLERFMPPELRAAAGYSENAAGEEPAEPDIQQADALAPDVLPSRAYRFFHAPIWKYLIGGLALLLLLGLFGMMCSPVYWRF